MEYWERNEDGVHFDTEEDAYQDFLENEDVDTLEDYLLKAVDLDVSALLHWAMSQDGFWEAFQDVITEAREMMFEDTYCHWDEPDDDDEIDELIADMEQRSATAPKHHYAVDAWGDLYEVNPTE
jgi:hypothetical protein